MGRRIGPGWTLAAAIGAPLLLFWAIALGLKAEYRASIRQVSGSGANSAAVDRLAERWATEQMNGWAGRLGVPALFLVAIGGWFAAEAVRARLNGPAKRLRTARLVLRRHRPEDVPAFHAILTDAPTLRYWGQAPHQSLEETARWLADAETEPGMRDEFVIEREGRVIGMIGARRWPWVTYLLLAAEGGQGYGGEALKAFVDYAFERGMPTLLVVTDARNAASLAMVRRRGFREIERMPLTHPTGETIDGVLLRLDRLVRRWPGLRRTAAPDKAVA